jgi:hypothetical protein
VLSGSLDAPRDLDEAAAVRRAGFRDTSISHDGHQRDDGIVGKVDLFDRVARLIENFSAHKLNDFKRGA